MRFGRSGGHVAGKERSRSRRIFRSSAAKGRGRILCPLSTVSGNCKRVRSSRSGTRKNRERRQKPEAAADPCHLQARASFQATPSVSPIDKSAFHKGFSHPPRRAPSKSFLPAFRPISMRGCDAIRFDSVRAVKLGKRVSRGRKGSSPRRVFRSSPAIGRGRISGPLPAASG